MPADHSKFLYTIVKQLDLKSIDWSAVAAQLNITNGHAARMRFSRFKQAMEGVVPAPRKRAGTSGSRPRRAIKSEKGGVDKKGFGTKVKDEDQSPEPSEAPLVKHEPTDHVHMAPAPPFPIPGTVPPNDAAAALESVLDPALSAGQDCVMSAMAPASPMAAPTSAPPTFGPSPGDFGPFAGTYPPPDVAFAHHPAHHGHHGHHDHHGPNHDPHQAPGSMVKEEPRWEG